MNKWGELKPLVSQLWKVNKQIVKGFFSIVKNKMHGYIDRNPLGAVLASTVTTFILMFGFTGFWFIKYTMLVKKQDVVKYEVEKQLDTARINAELKGREEMKMVYESRLDSIQSALDTYQIQQQERQKQTYYKKVPKVETPKAETTSEETKVEHSNEE